MKGNKKAGIALNTKKSSVTESTLAPWLSDSCAIEDCDHKKAYYGNGTVTPEVSADYPRILEIKTEFPTKTVTIVGKDQNKEIVKEEVEVIVPPLAEAMISEPPNPEYISEFKEKFFPKEVEAEFIDIKKEDIQYGIELDKEKALQSARPQYSHDQLLQALYWIFDAFERSNMNFFLIYSTAESVLEQKDLEGDKITVGVRDMIWASGARQIFETYVQYVEKVDNKLTYTADNGVPVEVTVFRDDECIMSPDVKMYHSEAFHLPNPYSRFLEVYK